MNQSAVVTILLALTVVLAGCSGAGIDLGGNGEDAASGNGGSGGNGDTGNGDSGDSANDGNGDSNPGDLSPGTVNFFEFEQPGRYVFEVETVEDGVGEVVWDIQEIDGDQLTLYVHYTVGDDDYETTMTGTVDDIQGQLLFSPAGSFMMLSLLSPTMGYYEGEELRVGKQWSFSTPQGSMSFEVTGIESYAGVSCFASELRINESVIHEGCVSPDIGLAPYTAYYDEDTGEVEMRVELIEFERR